MTTNAEKPDSVLVARARAFLGNPYAYAEGETTSIPYGIWNLEFKSVWEQTGGRAVRGWLLVEAVKVPDDGLKAD